MNDRPYKTGPGIRRTDRWQATRDGVSLVRGRPEPLPIRFPADPSPVETDMAASALIIVDMQNDFIHPEGWFPALRGVDPAPLRQPIGTINMLSATFRAVGAPVIHLNWGIRADAANLPANVLDRGSACGTKPGYGDIEKHGAILVRGSWGAATIDEIEVADSDIRVDKHRLSGFRDNELDQILRRLGVTTLFYAGVNIDRCVFATLTDGAFQGFDSVLVTDACATVSPDSVSDSVIYLVRLLYGFTAESTDIASSIQSIRHA